MIQNSSSETENLDCNFGHNAIWGHHDIVYT